MRAQLALLLVLAGCLDKAANDCGGGIVGGGCALPEQLAACDGASDGTATGAAATA